MSSNTTVGIIGLGYVGLPLALAFSRHYDVIGYDIDAVRIHALEQGIDHTHEVSPAALADTGRLRFSHDPEELSNCTVFIITVPTPLTPAKTPDLSFLIQASQMVARYLRQGGLVIYESTVYPGCTEEDCVPVLERESGLVYNKDFFVGYSPERINPGDPSRPVTAIRKLTAGSTPETADRVDALYARVITAGTYRAPSIRVAEAAKAIENAQRDLNISFMNELSLIFDRLGIDTQEVLKAAATKWNFLPFRPGLVGGHCIGVDPHYLAHRAIKAGYQPEVILSGRRVNERMGIFVAEKMIALLAGKKQGAIRGSRVLILGMAFKENCADTRNTKVVDIYHTLQSAGIEVLVYDPLVSAEAVQQQYGIRLYAEMPESFDGLILAVAHQAFLSLPFADYHHKGVLIYDTQAVIDRDWVHGRL